MKRALQSILRSEANFGVFTPRGLYCVQPYTRQPRSILAMKPALSIVFAAAVVGCSQPATPQAPKNVPANAAGMEAQTAGTPTTSTAPPKPDVDAKPSAVITPLTAEQQHRLLDTRLDGGMEFTFGQFSNMFLVSSQINLGSGVGLVTASKEIAESPLQSPFPASYQPTLREFLDAIALQTSADWKYDPTGKFVHSDVPREDPSERLALFEFTGTKREKPFAVTLAQGWKANDKGNWVMYVPPAFPVGMDIYEMGTYSCPEPKREHGFADEIRSAVALEWAKRVNEKAQSEDLKRTKVGKFDALFYETLIHPQPDQNIKWRHWVFMDGDKCYFIVSTLPTELDGKVFPDLEKMLASFRIDRQSSSTP